MEEKEIWRDIRGFEELYQVSNLGRVKSLPRLVRDYNGMRMLKERILKDEINIKNKYHRVHLSRDGKGKHFLVHRLVYEAFVGEIPDGMQVNHIDENKNNNSISNLNLMTSKENINWGSGIKRGHKKLERKVVMDNEKEFDSLKKSAEYLGCNATTVLGCCKNPTYTVFGHHFRYK